MPPRPMVRRRSFSGHNPPASDSPRYANPLPGARRPRSVFVWAHPSRASSSWRPAAPVNRRCTTAGSVLILAAAATEPRGDLRAADTGERRGPVAGLGTPVPRAASRANGSGEAGHGAGGQAGAGGSGGKMTGQAGSAGSAGAPGGHAGGDGSAGASGGRAGTAGAGGLPGAGGSSGSGGMGGLGPEAPAGRVTGYGTVLISASSKNQIVRLQTTMVVPPEPPPPERCSCGPGCSRTGPTSIRSTTASCSRC